MRFQIKRTPGEGLTFEIQSRDGVRLRRGGMVLAPSLYRVAARRTVARLLDANRKLRMEPQRRQGRLSTLMAKLAEWYLKHRSDSAAATKARRASNDRTG